MSTQESIHMSDTQTFKSGINQLVAKALNNGGIASLRNCQTTTPDGQLINFEIIVHSDTKASPVSNTDELIKKESGLVKFNCQLNYSSIDCNYESKFHSGKNTPDQVLVDVIEHLGWMASVDGDAKRAIAALNEGIERGGARVIELASINTPQTEIHPAAQQKEGFVLVPVDALREVLHTAGDALMDERTSSVFDRDGTVSTWYDHYHVAEQQLIGALEAQEPT